MARTTLEAAGSVVAEMSFLGGGEVGHTHTHTLSGLEKLFARAIQRDPHGRMFIPLPCKMSLAVRRGREK